MAPHAHTNIIIYFSSTIQLDTETQISGVLYKWVCFCINGNQTQEVATAPPPVFNMSLRQAMEAGLVFS